MAAPATASGTSRDKQNKSFVDSPTRGSDYSAQEVFVGNTDGNPVPSSDHRGPTKYQGNESLIIASSTGSIVTFIVGVGKIAELLCVSVSGQNKATYKLVIDSVTVETVRTYYTHFNEKMFLNDLFVGENKTVSIQATNESDIPAFFNATIYYKEYDE